MAKAMPNNRTKSTESKQSGTHTHGETQKETGNSAVSGHKVRTPTNKAATESESCICLGPSVRVEGSGNATARLPQPQHSPDCGADCGRIATQLRAIGTGIEVRQERWEDAADIEGRLLETALADGALSGAKWATLRAEMEQAASGSGSWQAGLKPGKSRSGLRSPSANVHRWLAAVAYLIREREETIGEFAAEVPSRYEKSRYVLQGGELVAALLESELPLLQRLRAYVDAVDRYLAAIQANERILADLGPIGPKDVPKIQSQLDALTRRVRGLRDSVVTVGQSLIPDLLCIGLDSAQIHLVEHRIAAGGEPDDLRTEWPAIKVSFLAAADRIALESTRDSADGGGSDGTADREIGYLTLRQIGKVLTCNGRQEDVRKQLGSNGELRPHESGKWIIVDKGLPGNIRDELRAAAKESGRQKRSGKEANSG